MERDPQPARRTRKRNRAEASWFVSQRRTRHDRLAEAMGHPRAPQRGHLSISELGRDWITSSSSGVVLSAELIAGGIGADRSGSVRDGVRVAIKFAARSEAV